MGTLVKMPARTSSRRGRLPAAERVERRAAVLSATEAALLDVGYDNVTMLSIAKRAGASKETLYSWFGNREGLFAELIERNADRSATAIDAALSDERPPHETLTSFGVGLLSLLTSPTSVALNHAAMQSPELATRLLASGRHRVGPLVEDFLASLHDRGVLDVPEPSEAFGVLYGLLVRDTQIRVLLGEAAPTPAAITRRSTAAVEQFFELFAP